MCICVTLCIPGADRPDVDDGCPGVVVQEGDDQAGEGRQGADQQLQSCCWYTFITAILIDSSMEFSSRLCCE